MTWGDWSNHNANLWFVIAEANALDGDGDLVAGATLTVPEVKTSSNDASTFKPYNPGEITGPTSPGLPYIAPPDKGCGTLGLIIMAVVAIVVTVYTAGAASGAMTAAAQAAGTTTAFASSATVTMAGITTTTAGILSTTGSIVAGAIAGAAGAAASLAAGSLMGVASFNWRGVAAGAITGGITGGIAAQYGSVAEALSGAGGIGKASVLALANGGANYAGQKLAGVDTSFSWRSIAASAVSSVVTAKVAPGLVKKMGIRGGFATDFAYGMTGGMVSLAARTSFGQTLHRSDYTTVVADAFGNALANSISRSRSAQPSVDKVGRDMQRSLDQLQAASDTRSSELAQAGLDRMADAGMTSNAARATARLQDRLQAGFNASWLARNTSGGSTAPGNNVHEVTYKYGADGRPYANDPVTLSYLSNLVHYAERYSGKDLRSLGHQQKIDYAYHFANGSQNPWSPESVPTDLEGMTVYADGRSVAEHMADRAQARTLREQAAHQAMVDFIRQRNDLGELRNIGDGVLSVVAPAIHHAVHNGSMFSVKEYFTGQWKYMGNQAIGLWNLSTELPSSAGGIARMMGYDPTIKEFEYTSGELTSAAITEAGTFALGAVLGAAKGLGYLDDVARISPAGYRGMGAVEKWGVIEVPNSAKALPDFGSLAPPSRLARPTWRQSELDLEGLYGPHGYDAQASYLNGQRVPHGTTGSTRPDVYFPGESIDIKNYNLTTSGGRSGLVRDVVAQAQTRATNLPVGDIQRVVIDVRGQNVSVTTLNRVSAQIAARSNGAIATDSIIFWR